LNTPLRCGREPFVEGAILGYVPYEMARAVRHRRIRLLWPEDRELNFRGHGTTAEPEVRTRSGIREYIWDLKRSACCRGGGSDTVLVPAYPWIQVSEFTVWSEVATWAAGLYLTTNLDAPELKEEIANLRRPGETPEQNVQGALEFAQNDIRYLGIEFGPLSYHPTDPVTVLRRRFGDCKDRLSSCARCCEVWVTTRRPCWLQQDSATPCRICCRHPMISIMSLCAWLPMERRIGWTQPAHTSAVR